MDHTRVLRIGNRPYYRSNFTPSSNTRQTIEERLHGRGVSTSSNSSWTFSNSHSDIPKPKKGRLCGIVLVGAVFIVVLAVLAIGGLAFYMGALRIESGKQELIFDGSLRITYGDQYQSTLSNHSSKNFQDKATRYSNMLTNVFQKSIIGASLEEASITKFENGSLIVHFRIILDRRKIPNSVTGVEDFLRNILIEEVSSVKPIAFRNLQVDRHNLFIKRYLGEELVSERPEATVRETATKKVEVKNGVVRKVTSAVSSPNPVAPETAAKPKESVEHGNKSQGVAVHEGTIIGISETMQNFTESIKIKKKGTSKETSSVSEIIHSDIKSVDFEDDIDNSSKIYQSVYVSSDNFEVKKNASASEKPQGVIEGSFKVTKTDAVESTMNGHARPPFVPDNSSSAPPTPVSGSVEYVVPEYSDEPWRPIMPSMPASQEPVEFRDSYVDIYDSVVSDDERIQTSSTEETHGVIEDEAPITFSRETYEQNLRIVPEYSGSNGKIKLQNLKNNKLSRITDDIAKKYKDLLKNHRLSEDVITGMAEVITSEEVKTEESVIKQPEPPALKQPEPSAMKELEPPALKQPEPPVLKQWESVSVKQPESSEPPAMKHSEPSEIFIVGETTSKTEVINATEENVPKERIVNHHSVKQNVNEKLEAPLGLDQMISGIRQVDTKLDEATETTAPEVTANVTNLELVPRVNNETTAGLNVTKEDATNVTVKNPFVETDDSRSSSVFNFGIPDLPILKQFHHLDSLFKSFSKSSDEPSQLTTTESSPGLNETVMTRFPARVKPTTSKNYRNEDKIYIEISTISPENSTRLKTTTRKPIKIETTTLKSIKVEPTTKKQMNVEATTKKQMNVEATTKKQMNVEATTKKSVIIKGEVEVLDEATKKEGLNFDKIPPITTTEVPKLITLLPVRSNVNMKRPLRPRPKPGEKKSAGGETMPNRKSKMTSEFQTKLSSKYTSRRNQTESSSPKVLYSIPHQQHQFVDDKDGKRWVYYSSSKLSTNPPEKLFIVTPEPKTTINYTNNGDFNDSVPIKEIRKEMVKIPEMTMTTTTRPKTQSFSGNITNIPIYNTIEALLNNDHRKKGNLRNDTKNSLVGVKTEGKSDRENGSTSEIVDKIVKIMENVAISTGNSTKVIMKVNQTLINETGTLPEVPKTSNEDPVNSTDTGKAVSSNNKLNQAGVANNYKLNQAGLTILTKVLNKDPNHYKNDGNHLNGYKNGLNEEISYSHLTKDCDNTSVRCGNGVCLPLSTRCNQLVECPDAADEKNCSCSEHLKAQNLHRKLCDGIVDCWDFTDEYGCDWCKEKEYLCSNSRMCIKKSEICDGVNNCPFGDDERFCVTVSPSKEEADSFNYHPNGYLMVRKHGQWGKLCIDNFENVSMQSKTGWKISDLGRSVCKALTFKDFDKVERMISIPNEGRSLTDAERYYELSYNDVNASTESYPRDSVLTFHETTCEKKEIVKVICTDLECGLRPQATNQWSRIVGGGNANPGAWPWQAALYKEGEFQCGATLVSSQWLISAGHCFYHNQDEYWVARLGTLRTTSSLPSPYEQLRQISKIILHPQYVDTGFINDISLLKMSDPVTFTDYVRPICLPKVNTKIVDGTMCTVVGWGQLFEIGRIFPDTLQEVQLPIISSGECRKRTVFLPLYKITDDMFCAGFERGGRDACLGDSGGPLMCQESDGKWSLYGVTSNGYGCARSNRPGVYTKVSRYLHWVKTQMNLHSEDDTIVHVRESQTKENSTKTKNDRLRDKYSASDAKQEADVIIKLISDRISNVKLSSSDNVKGKDKCKGHRCPLGECLPKSRLCNGYIECSDGSDEKDCW